MLRHVVFVFEGNEELLVILSRGGAWWDPHFRKSLQVAERIGSEGMASERQFGRLKWSTVEELRTKIHFPCALNWPFSPFSSIFPHSPRYIYLFCPRSLDEWSTGEKPAYLPARYTLKSSASTSPIQGVRATGVLAVNGGGSWGHDALIAF